MSSIPSIRTPNKKTNSSALILDLLWIHRNMIHWITYFVVLRDIISSPKNRNFCIRWLNFSLPHSPPPPCPAHGLYFTGRDERTAKSERRRACSRSVSTNLQSSWAELLRRVGSNWPNRRLVGTDRRTGGVGGGQGWRGERRERTGRSHLSSSLYPPSAEGLEGDEGRKNRRKKKRDVCENTPKRWRGTGRENELSAIWSCGAMCSLSLGGNPLPIVLCMNALMMVTQDLTTIRKIYNGIDLKIYLL